MGEWGTTLAVWFLAGSSHERVYVRVLPATLSAHASATFGDDESATFGDDGGPRLRGTMVISPG